MKSWVLVLVALTLLLAARCHPQPSPGFDGGPPVGTGGAPADAGLDAATGGSGGAAPSTQADCDAAEAKLRELKCVDGNGAPLWQGPTGEPFGKRCYTELMHGNDLHATCLKTISNCTQADSASQGFYCLDGGAS